MAIKLRDLEYLVALADHGNFHRAAEICGVSQPTLSAQIRKFEEDLGVPLFERSRRHVILTEGGKRLLPRARRMLDEAAQIRVEAEHLREIGAPRLHLGVFPTLGPYLLPHVVPRFLKEMPGIELMLTEEKSGVLLRRLVEGGIDAALLALPNEDGGLTSRELFDEPFRLAVPLAHELAHRQTVNPRELSGQKLMLLEEGHCLRDQALALCRQSGARELDDFRGTSLETLRQMVTAGVGVTLLPAMATRETGAMAALPIASGAFKRRIGLFWRKTSGQTALMERLGDLIRSVAEGLMAASARS